MGVVADAAMGAGGRATGVITEALAGHEIAHGTLNDLHVVATMHERKALMSDCRTRSSCCRADSALTRNSWNPSPGRSWYPRQALRHSQRRRILRRSSRLRAPRCRTGLHTSPAGRGAGHLRRRRRTTRLARGLESGSGPGRVEVSVPSRGAGVATSSDARDREPDTDDRLRPKSAFSMTEIWCCRSSCASPISIRMVIVSGECETTEEQCR